MNRPRAGAAKGDIVMMQSAGGHEEVWPSLALEDWSDTCATLHMWAQIVGKIRLVQSPWVNHSWHATLYVTSTGLTTSPIPYGARTFQIDFDFINHQLGIRASDGGIAGFSLEPQSVAEFYRHLMDEMRKLDLHVDIYRKPNEVADPIRFDQDAFHRAYAQEHANRFWRILVQTDRILKEFRARFIGKCSPVHLFWGALDLAVTRFSGRSAPQHPGGVPNLPDFVTREAYSHEVSSCGFWPGGGAVPYAAFYSYAYPEPAGFSQVSIKPPAAFYSPDLREFILPYDTVRRAASPENTLLEFLQATYEAAADLSNWDRKSLERSHDPKRPIQRDVGRPR
jgi:hypothetical protein